MLKDDWQKMIRTGRQAFPLERKREESRQMLNRDNAIWEELLAHLRSELSDREFMTWFAQVKPVGIQDGAFVLAVNGSFTRDWIRDNYLERLEEVLHSLGAEAPRIGLQVVPLDSSEQQDIFALQDDDGEASAEPRPAPPPRLSSKYRFESFVVGSNNNLAHAAAQAVAERPGHPYNPP